MTALDLEDLVFAVTIEGSPLDGIGISAAQIEPLLFAVVGNTQMATLMWER